METFTTIDDLINLWRPLSLEQKIRTNALPPVVSYRIHVESDTVGHVIDKIIAESEVYKDVVKSVTVDIVARTLMTSTNQEPMTQYSESALGYSVSKTFLTPGGGLFIKRDELKALGLRKQRYGVMEVYDYDKRHHRHSY